MTKPRDYKKATEYENQPEQVANRVARNRARRETEKKLGHKLPSNVDVDHKKMLKDGGSKTDPKNLRVVSEHKNTGWRKGVKGYG